MLVWHAVEFVKDYDIVVLHFNSRAVNIYFASELSSLINRMYNQMLEQAEKPRLPRSGSALNRVLSTNP